MVQLKYFDWNDPYLHSQSWVVPCSFRLILWRLLVTFEADQRMTLSFPHILKFSQRVRQRSLHIQSLPWIAKPFCKKETLYSSCLMPWENFIFHFSFVLTVVLPPSHTDHCNIVKLKLPRQLCDLYLKMAVFENRTTNTYLVVLKAVWKIRHTPHYHVINALECIVDKGVSRILG